MRGCRAASDSNPRLTRADERVVSALFAAGTRPLSFGLDSSIMRPHSLDYGGEAFSRGADLLLGLRFHFTPQNTPLILCFIVFRTELVHVLNPQFWHLSLDR